MGCRWKLFHGAMHRAANLLRKTVASLMSEGNST